MVKLPSRPHFDAPEDSAKAAPVNPVEHFEKEMKLYGPKIMAVTKDAGGNIARYVATYESSTNREEKARLYKMATQRTDYYTQMLTRLMHTMFPKVMPADLSGERNKVVDVLGWLDDKKSVPGFLRKFGYRMYRAPIRVYGGQTIELQMKAPNASMAQLFLLYRLLRKSSTNKKLGNVAKITYFHKNRPLFPDVNLKLLSSWAHSRFAMIEDNSVRGLRTQMPQRQQYSKGYMADRVNDPHANHKFAIPWRHG